MPKPQVSAGSWGEKCEAKQRLRQAPNSKLQTVGSIKVPILASKLSPAKCCLAHWPWTMDSGRLCGKCLGGVKNGHDLKEQLFSPWLSTVAKSCWIQSEFIYFIYKRSLDVPLFACSKLVHLIAKITKSLLKQQIPPKVQVTTNSPWDQELGTWYMRGQLLKLLIQYPRLNPISWVLWVNLCMVLPFNKHPEGLKGSRISSLDSPTMNSKRTFRIPS